MLPSPKVAALAAGLIAALSMATLAQQQQPGNGGNAKPARSAGGETLVVGGHIDWLETSQVSALTEGVIKQIEFQVGDRIEKGQPIGYLHEEKAKLAVAKAKLVANNEGEIAKAEAQERLAMSQLARLQNLEKRGRGFASKDELDKAAAEVAVGNAMVKAATEQQAVAKADLDLAERTLEEHTIIAPFTGYITDRMKNPEEAVRANDPIVRLGRIDKLRFVGYLPLESAMRIKVGSIADVHANVDGAELPIEKKLFRGKVTAIGREISRVAKTEVQVLAEIDNKEDPEHPELILQPGLKADMTIYLNPADAPPAGVKTAAKRPVR